MTATDRDRKRNLDRLYADARTSAVSYWGGPSTFAKLGAPIRESAVARELFYLIAQQDESVPAETVRLLANGMHDRLAEDERLHS